MNAKSPFSWCQAAVTLGGSHGDADRVEHRTCMDGTDRGQGRIGGSPGYEFASGPKGSEGRYGRRTDRARLIALLVLCGVVGTAVSGCASFKGSSFNSARMSDRSGCPGQEGYPDCQPN